MATSGALRPVLEARKDEVLRNSAALLSLPWIASFVVETMRLIQSPVFLDVRLFDETGIGSAIVRHTDAGSYPEARALLETWHRDLESRKAEPVTEERWLPELELHRAADLGLSGEALRLSFAGTGCLGLHHLRGLLATQIGTNGEVGVRECCAHRCAHSPLPRQMLLDELRTFRLAPVSILVDEMICDLWEIGTGFPISTDLHPFLPMYSPGSSPLHLSAVRLFHRLLQQAPQGFRQAALQSASGSSALETIETRIASLVRFHLRRCLRDTDWSRFERNMSDVAIAELMESYISSGEDKRAGFLGGFAVRHRQRMERDRATDFVLETYLKSLTDTPTVLPAAQPGSGPQYRSWKILRSSRLLAWKDHDACTISNFSIVGHSVAEVPFACRSMQQYAELRDGLGHAISRLKGEKWSHLAPETVALIDAIGEVDLKIGLIPLLQMGEAADRIVPTKQPALPKELPPSRSSHVA
ncbi:hypothetical protein DFJ74DRAFT_108960 [Hyaloraphidium curvatum]|nr:hypothetical protein DFJ74DRAFT_108960 [Hyaloraphidium curvatum]